MRAIPLVAFAALASVGFAQTAPLTDAQAKKICNARSCNACHAVDETRLGPAFRTVALRYHDTSASTVEWLATKIVHGGAGAWGNVPMVSNPAVSAEEARALARWILELRPAPPKPGSS